MIETASLILLPESLTETRCSQISDIVARALPEPIAELRRRVWLTGFACEQAPLPSVNIIAAELEARGMAFAKLSSGSIPALPRRLIVEQLDHSHADHWNFTVGANPFLVPTADFLHATLGLLRVEGQRRTLTRGGRDLRVEHDVTLVDLYFRGGAAYRIDLSRIALNTSPPPSAPNPTELNHFLSDLARRAAELRRPVVPGLRPLQEGLQSRLWSLFESPDLRCFEARSRWWFALAANRLLPSQSQLDELLSELDAARKAKLLRGGDSRLLRPSTIAPRPTQVLKRSDLTTKPTTNFRPVTPPPGAVPPVAAPALPGYEDCMRRGSQLEARGQIEAARSWYREALAQRDCFEARLALIEALVDSDPFEAWRLCAEAATRFPNESEKLIEEYKGVHRENYDCHDFLTYRALRRFLRVRAIAMGATMEPIEAFFDFHDLSHKLPNTTKGGLLDTYGREMNFQFPPIHRSLLSAYNGLDLFNRAIRLLGVGGDDEAFDLFVFNNPIGWRRFYGQTLNGLVGFAYDYLGNVFFFDPRLRPIDPPIVRLDCDSGELEPIADNFAEFISLDLTDPDQDIARPRLLRAWQASRGQLAMRECLSFQSSPALGGEKSLENLTTSELGIRLHMAGQIAQQSRLIPEGARILGVRVVNQEDLILKVLWEL